MTGLVGRIADGVFINMATPAKIREIAGRVRKSAGDSGRDPKGMEIVAKCRVSLSPDRSLARARLRQVLTFYNLADHYSDMLKQLGFEEDVSRIQNAFQKGGFKSAMAALSDSYMDKLPVVPGTSISEIKERLAPFVEAGATRLVVPYVPVREPVLEDAKDFLRAWGKNA
jgi:alkanesulfonate monooxygenase SsuD/methylene tetrahydromethanopterin reductase-like flavin-dependent oxidoreductase (luciferase family)